MELKYPDRRVKKALLPLVFLFRCGCNGKKKVSCPKIRLHSGEGGFAAHLPLPVKHIKDG